MRPGWAGSCSARTAVTAAGLATATWPCDREDRSMDMGAVDAVAERRHDGPDCDVNSDAWEEERVPWRAYCLCLLLYLLRRWLGGDTAPFCCEPARCLRLSADGDVDVARREEREDVPSPINLLPRITAACDSPMLRVRERRCRGS